MYPVYVYFFSGEKHMKWYYRKLGLDYRQYDQEKFKIAHSLTITLLFLIAYLLTSFGSDSWITILLPTIASVVLDYYLIKTWCKKKS